MKNLRTNFSDQKDEQLQVNVDFSNVIGAFEDVILWSTPPEEPHGECFEALFRDKKYKAEWMERLSKKYSSGVNSENVKELIDDLAGYTNITDTDHLADVFPDDELNQKFKKLVSIEKFFEKAWPKPTDVGLLEFMDKAKEAFEAQSDEYHDFVEVFTGKERHHYELRGRLAEEYARVTKENLKFLVADIEAAAVGIDNDAMAHLRGDSILEGVFNKMLLQEKPAQAPSQKHGL